MMKMFEELMGFSLLIIMPIRAVYPVEACVLIGSILFATIFYRFGWKLAIGTPLVFILAAYAIHLIDMYFAYRKLNELCSEPTFIVHEERKLSKDYWDEGGWPIFFTAEGRFLPEVFDGRYVIMFEEHKVYSFFDIDRGVYFLYDNVEKTKMVEYRKFRLKKGLFRKMLNLNEYPYYEKVCDRWDYRKNEIPGSLHNGPLTSWVFVPIDGFVDSY